MPDKAAFETLVLKHMSTQPLKGRTCTWHGVVLVTDAITLVSLYMITLLAVVHAVLTGPIVNAVATPTPLLDIASANRGSNTGGSEEIASSGATNTPECDPYNSLSHLQNSQQVANIRMCCAVCTSARCPSVVM